MPTGWRPRDYVAPGSGWDDRDPTWYVPRNGDPAHLPTAIASHLTALRVRESLLSQFGSVQAALGTTGISGASLYNAIEGRGQWSMRVLADLTWRVGPEVLPTPLEIATHIEMAATRQEPGNPHGIPPLPMQMKGAGRHRPARND